MQNARSQETDLVNRYSAHYEAHLDPFSAFNTKVCYIIVSGRIFNYHVGKAKEVCSVKWS